MGPLLFNIFVNDMFESTTCKLDAYANDFTLTANGSTAQVKLTFDRVKINNWIALHRMVFNADKIHLMIFGTDNLTRSAGDTRVTITKTNTENLLGCYIDQNIK